MLIPYMPEYVFQETGALLFAETMTAIDVWEYRIAPTISPCPVFICNKQHLRRLGVDVCNNINAPSMCLGDNILVIRRGNVIL